MPGLDRTVDEAGDVYFVRGQYLLLLCFFNGSAPMLWLSLKFVGVLFFCWVL